MQINRFKSILKGANNTFENALVGANNFCLHYLYIKGEKIMLEKIASFFSSALGFVIGIIFTFGVLLPLNVIGLPLWADFVILVVLQFTMLIGKLISAGLWIWGLILLLGAPITTFSIIYFVVFGIYVLYFGLSLVAAAFDR